MLISVISPTGNRLPYLKECIASVGASVLAGVDAQFEHVVLLAGEETGETRAWLSSDEKPAFVRVLESAKQVPPGQARNLAIAEARGEWIAVLDDDDVMLQRTLFHFAHAALQHPHHRWFISDFIRVDDQLRYVAGDDYYGWPFASEQEMLQAIFRSEHFVQGNVFFQKSLFEEVGGYDPDRRTAEDLELYCRFLLHHEKPLNLPIVSHLHRGHSHNTSKDIGRDHHFNDLRQIYAKLEPELRLLGVELSLPI